MPQLSFGFVSGPGKAVESPPFQTGLPEDPLLASGRYQVHTFRSDILPGDRSVAVYLPEQYLLSTDQRFPVFYLHDGQNLFDGRTSYIPGRTWRAHEAADCLNASRSIRPLILVGIANGGIRRMAEYTPSRDFKLGGGEGPSYGRLLMEELKPLIDSRYRTLPDPAHTGLGGSSLGGLISLYLGLKRPDVFGRIAVLSPSLWWDHRSILNLASRVPAPPHSKLWLDMGTAEGVRHLRDADLLNKTLLQHGWSAGKTLFYTRVEGGVHSEEAWASRFGDVLRFLFPAEEIQP